LSKLVNIQQVACIPDEANRMNLTELPEVILKLLLARSSFVSCRWKAFHLHRVKRGSQIALTQLSSYYASIHFEKENPRQQSYGQNCVHEHVENIILVHLVMPIDGLRVLCEVSVPLEIGNGHEINLTQKLLRATGRVTLIILVRAIVISTVEVDVDLRRREQGESQ
jgi:hypothetical protein